MLKTAGHFSSPHLLTYLEGTLKMSTQPPEPPPDENPPDGAPDGEKHPIDVTISVFDEHVNKLRNHAGKLSNNATATCVNYCLAALVAVQGFMREVRKLFGDLI